MKVPIDNNSFQKLSEEVAAKFLQTVVIVDDQPTSRKISTIGTEADNTVKPDQLNLPGRRRPRATPKVEQGSNNSNVSTEKISDLTSDENLPTKEIVSTLIEDGENEAIETTTIVDAVHELRAQELIDIFAERGLICSIIEPDENQLELLPQRVVKVARHADLIILDWKLYQSIGDTTVQIIKDIIESDRGTDGRLRTIAIYTGEKDIHGIAERISLAIDGLLLEGKEEGCVVEKNKFVRIAVFAKDHVSVLQQYSNRKVSLNDLPDKLISEFSKITSGLVANVALDSLAALRTNTHLLLAKLHSGIDIPFLTHRALLPRPDDSAEYLIDLIAAEIRVLLDQYEVEKNASSDVVQRWLASNYNDNSTYLLGSSGSSDNLNFENMNDLLKNGICNWNFPGQGISEKKQDSKKRELHKYISQALCQDGRCADDLDNEFAILTSLGRQYSSKSNNDVFKLTLGTILEQELHLENPDVSAKYWLCIQPRCDSSRIEKNRSFPLLPLEVVAGDNKFSFIVKSFEGNIIKLKLLGKAHNVKMECFTSDPSRGGAVIANQIHLPTEDETTPCVNSKSFFETTEGTKYFWIAELKRDHAQRVANSFANNLSRVGLNESEWLRRWST